MDAANIRSSLLSGPPIASMLSFFLSSPSGGVMYSWAAVLRDRQGVDSKVGKNLDAPRQIWGSPAPREDEATALMFD